MFKSVDPKPNFPEMEKKILKHWYEKGIVEKYLHRNDSSKKRFSFMDGPITANNPMGVHHAWGRTYKDLIQRFNNMKGAKQRFQNGFDCQGLWVEVEVEKELGLKNKKEIENLVPGDKKASIAKFVDLCKERVKKFSAIQTEQSKRLGYFMDWDHSYYTMSSENNYMIWNFLKVCHEKGFIYKGEDSVPWCPRCETAISQHEMLTEDYKEITHETVFLKLPIITKGWENTFLLVWTTTPWTIPANVAVGINKKYTYHLWENKENNEKIIILGKDELGNIPTRLFKGKEIPVNEYIFNNVETQNIASLRMIKELPGSQLIGLKYQAPFDNLERVKEAQKENLASFHTVVDGSEIVVSTEGTGLLHVAPGAGQEDFKLGKKEHLSIIAVIDDQANYLDKMGDFSFKNAKKHPEIIIDYLKKLDNGKFLLKTLPFTHRYPACWRCKTELVWKVTNQWYIAMDKKEIRQLMDKSQNSKLLNKTLREQMIEVAKQIKWIPEFGLERELDWLKNMHDWLISKPNRYWGLALPIWECAQCGHFEVIGSYEELKTKAVSGWDQFAGHTPHKPFIDEVKIKCPKCQETVDRLPDVGNVWLDAGIVPYATLIDPKDKKISFLTDKKYWQEWFPVDFITESFPGQFKNWFYAMIAESTVLTNKIPYKTVFGYATLFGGDARPMHKSWGNAIEFNEGADLMGVDVMRWMFAAQNPVDNMLFGYNIADETRRRFHLLLWNIYNFFITYALIDKWSPQKNKVNLSLLDQWILVRLDDLILTTTKSLNTYDIQTASLTLEKFVNDLSTWYLRRSRDRVGPATSDQKDKNSCYDTLYQVLVTLTKLLAPFTPFISEEIYQNLTGKISIHLEDWPKENKLNKLDYELLSEMEEVRNICQLGHAQRKQSQIKVRQPLTKITIKYLNQKLEKFDDLIKAELNIKKIIWEKSKDILEVKIDTVISPDLQKEGEARGLVRQIQEERKKLGWTLLDEIDITLPSWPLDYTEYIKKETLAKNLIKGETMSIKKHDSL